jgi:hypothetical protein
LPLGKKILQLKKFVSIMGHARKEPDMIVPQQPSSPQAASSPMSAAALSAASLAVPHPHTHRAQHAARRTPALSRHYRAGAADGRAIRVAAC